MFLWLLKRTDRADWDENRAFVVRAETEEKARQIAFTKATGGEDMEVWPGEDPSIWLTTATCTKLEHDGPEEIVLRDFNAG